MTPREGIPLDLLFIQGVDPDWIFGPDLGITGAVLIFFGIELLLCGAIDLVLQTEGLGLKLSSKEYYVVVAGFVGGLVFAVSGALRLTNTLLPYVILLFCFGRAIEGAGAVRFYRQILNFLSRRQSETTGVSSAIKYGLVSVFLTFLAVWLGFQVISQGPFIGTRLQSLKLIWTGLVIVTVGLGVGRKLSHADVLNRPLRYGMVLTVIGAEIFNFSTLGIEIIAYLLGTFAFSLGYGVAVYFLFSTEI